jgi:hypothetical protein
MVMENDVRSFNCERMGLNFRLYTTSWALGIYSFDAVYEAVYTFASKYHHVRSNIVQS